MDCSPPGSSVEFSRPEYWSGLPFPSPGDLPNPGIKPRSPVVCKALLKTISFRGEKAWLFKSSHITLVTQSCPTLCDPMDCSPLGSSVYRLTQARILEGVAISYSRGSSQVRDRTWFSRTTGRLFYPLSHQGSPNWSEFQFPLFAGYQQSSSLSRTEVLFSFAWSLASCNWSL